MFIVVTSPNNAPVAADLQFTIDEDTEFTGILTGSDNDGDDLLWNLLTEPENGIVLVSSDDSSFTYMPNSNYNGNDIFSFTVSDGNLEDTATVSFNIESVNDVPVVSDSLLTTLMNTAIDFTMTGTDVDQDSLTYELIIQPNYGQLSGSVPNLVYTPNPNFYGDDSLTFQVNDGQFDSQFAEVIFNITQQNDIPVVQGSALGALNGEAEWVEKIMELMGHVDSYIPEPERETDKDFLMPVEDVFSITCLLYTSPSPRDRQKCRMPSSA